MLQLPTHPKIHHFRRFHDFASELPKEPREAFKGASREAKMSPKTRPGRPRSGPRRAKMAPGAAKTAPGAPQDPPQRSNKRLQELSWRPGAAQRPPGPSPGALQASIWASFGAFEASFRMVFGVLFSACVSRQALENTVRNHSSKSLSNSLHACCAELLRLSGRFWGRQPHWRSGH